MGAVRALQALSDISTATLPSHLGKSRRIVRSHTDLQYMPHETIHRGGIVGEFDDTIGAA